MVDSLKGATVCKISTAFYHHLLNFSSDTALELFSVENVVFVFHFQAALKIHCWGIK